MDNVLLYQEREGFIRIRWLAAKKRAQHEKAIKWRNNGIFTTLERDGWLLRLFTIILPINEQVMFFSSIFLDVLILLSKTYFLITTVTSCKTIWVMFSDFLSIYLFNEIDSWKWFLKQPVKNQEMLLKFRYFFPGYAKFRNFSHSF